MMYENILLHFCAPLLILLVHGGNGLQTMDITDMRTYSSVYYDPISRKLLIGDLEDRDRITTSSILKFRGLPCSCANSMCSCCTGVNVTFLNFDRRICTNVTYVPQEFALQIKLLMNDQELFSNQMSAKNPPPVCVPMPYIPFMSLCVRLHDIHTQGSNLHTCVDFEIRIIRYPVLVLHFDCIRMGSDGIAWIKPGNSSVPQKPQSTTNLSESYDVVNFESEDQSAVYTQTSTLPPEEEALIGQLKL